MRNTTSDVSPIAPKLPAKALIPTGRIGITAAGPLLTSTGFPLKLPSTSTKHSLQKRVEKINSKIEKEPEKPSAL